MVCESPVKRGPRKGQSATGTDAGYQRHKKWDETPCDSCAQAHSRKTMKWQQENPEKYARKQRLYRQSHPDKWKGYQAKYRQTHRQELKEADRRWRIENPEKHAEKERRRRARKAEVLTIPFTSEQLDQRMSMWGYRCWMCGGPFEAVDHVKPISKGGAHILANLRPACVSCNSSKGAN